MGTLLEDFSLLDHLTSEEALQSAQARALEPVSGHNMRLTPEAVSGHNMRLTLEPAPSHNMIRTLPIFGANYITILALADQAQG